jgi:hypothetical protein
VQVQRCAATVTGFEPGSQDASLKKMLLITFSQQEGGALSLEI